MIAEIIGYMAAIVGTSLMLPQMIKSFKTKKMTDISSGMLLLYFLNCVLWLAYGVLISAMPVIVCNFIALIISVAQIAMKRKYG
ncbi:MAG: SemiSWEET family transporter [bacterium]